MSSINPILDAAMVARKARAAEFDDRWSMDAPGVDFFDLTNRAIRNLQSAQHALVYGPRENIRRDLNDAGNLCDLAWSLCRDRKEP